MSRLRKSGRKTKGYLQPDYTNKFKGGVALNIAGMTKEMVRKGQEFIAAKKEEEASAAAEAKAAKDKATASPSDRPVDEIDDKKMNYGREEVDSFFQRKKLAEEQAEFDAKKKEEEGEEEENPNVVKDSDGNVQYTDEYDPDMSKGDRRAEKKSNKREIKENFRAAKDACSGKRGRAKRQCKRSARKDKRSAKKSNRQSNRAARRASKGK